MLYQIGESYSQTFLRLFSSHLVLLSIGAFLSAVLTWFFLPRFWDHLPSDHGKALVPGGEKSKGKPTGAGIIISLCLIPAFLLTIPPSFEIYIVIVSFYLMMLAGYLDDKSAIPWGDTLKGFIDLIPCLLCSFALLKSGANTIWLPFTSKIFVVNPYLYIFLATFVLFVAINTLNCSDGVDGLAGSLGVMALLSLSVVLYLVLGYKPVSDYLLLPHYPYAAKWAIVFVSISSAFAAYLWYNASPSMVLMGDAGSRMLGLAIGVAILIAGNPFLYFVFAPVIFVNGGGGLIKTLSLRFLKKIGIDTTNYKRLLIENSEIDSATEEKYEVLAKKQYLIVRALHHYRFPFHDHCRKELKWSNAQVLMRFILIQSALTPILFTILLKVR